MEQPNQSLFLSSPLHLSPYQLNQSFSLSRISPTATRTREEAQVVTVSGGVTKASLRQPIGFYIY